MSVLQEIKLVETPARGVYTVSPLGEQILEQLSKRESASATSSAIGERISITLPKELVKWIDKEVGKNFRKQKPRHEVLIVKKMRAKERSKV